MTIIVASRQDGIGTRLLTILYARRFAELTGCELAVHWPDLNNPNYKNNDLLTTASLSDIFAEERLFRDTEVSWVGASFRDAQRIQKASDYHVSQRPIDEIAEFISGLDIFEYDIPEALWIGDHAEDEATEIRQLWARLNFQEDLRMAARAVLVDVEPDTAVAVHIRRGDIVNMLSEQSVEVLIQSGMIKVFQRYIPFKTAVNLISERFTRAPYIIVCSEDPNMPARIAERFPLKSVRSSLEQFAQGSNKAAVLDIMLLADVKDIISPYYSLFSRCASIVGGSILNSVVLDLPSLVAELVEELERRAPVDLEARKAVVFAAAYQNVSHYPENDQFKIYLRTNAVLYNHDIFERMTTHV